MLQFVKEDREIDRREVLGIPVTDFSRDEALQWVHGRIAAGAYTPVAFLNAHSANLSMDDAVFRRTLQGFTILSDGLGLDLAARVLYGQTFRANLNATDFLPDLLRTSPIPLKVGLFGGKPGTAHEAGKTFAGIDERHEYRVIHHGFFNRGEERNILADLAAWKPDLLLVAMGAPKQEMWIADKLTPEHCTVAMGVDTLFDFANGAILRAPKWVRAIHAEWVYRLAGDPRRIAERYLLGSPLFLARVVRWKIAAGH